MAVEVLSPPEKVCGWCVVNEGMKWPVGALCPILSCPVDCFGCALSIISLPESYRACLVLLAFEIL